VSENKDKDNKIIDFSKTETFTPKGKDAEELAEKAKSHIEDLKKNLVDNAVANFSKSVDNTVIGEDGVLNEVDDSVLTEEEAIKLVENSNRNIQHTPDPQLSDEDCMRIADLVVSRLLNNSKEQQKHISIIERQVYDITSIAYAAAVGCTDILRSGEHESEIAISINRERYEKYLAEDYSKGLTADHYEADTVYFHFPHVNEETGMHHAERISKRVF